VEKFYRAKRLTGRKNAEEREREQKKKQMGRKQARKS